MPPRRSHFLSDRCREFFELPIIQRGNLYFHENQVETLEVQDHYATFQVTGSELYRVQISWPKPEKKQVQVECTCPYFSSGLFCKHLWACLLTLDKISPLDDVFLGSREITLVSILNSGTSESKADEDLGRPRVSQWASRLATLEAQSQRSLKTSALRSPAPPPTGPTEYWFVINLKKTNPESGIRLEFATRSLKTEGAEFSFRKIPLSPADAQQEPHSETKSILLNLLLTAKSSDEYRYSYRSSESFNAVTIPNAQLADLISPLVATGRLLYQEAHSKTPHPLPVSDAGALPWDFQLSFSNQGDFTQLVGLLTRLEESRRIDDTLLVSSSGLVLFRESIGWMKMPTPFVWITALRESPTDFLIPNDELQQFAATLRQSSTCPQVQWPETLKWEERHVEPQPIARIQRRDHSIYSWSLEIQLQFLYESIRIPADDPRALLSSSTEPVVYRRDLEMERKYFYDFQHVAEAHHPFRIEKFDRVEIPQYELARLVTALIDAGFRVEAFDKPVQTASSPRLQFERSEIDWLDLSIEVEFPDGAKLAFPELLKAIRENSRLVQLTTGALGILPTHWLEQLAPVMAIGKETAKGWRLGRAQTFLLHSALEETPLIERHRETYRAVQNQLTRLTQPSARETSEGFNGSLRAYQAIGLGWLEELAEAGLGGILADDMGLGKTIQALAYLEKARSVRQKTQTQHQPSLVVAPKSLLFNWKKEAERFAPHLQVMGHEGPHRTKDPAVLQKADLVLVTYATLRNDWSLFEQIEFHAVFADEAQAIKNPQSLSSFACRSIHAKLKVAMTGTPVENSLHDLFSLLDFTNPGLLAETARRRYLSASSSGSYNKNVLQTLTRAIRPFVLRRTKDQVLHELPEKSEQILYCELSGPELKAYRELRDHYRLSLQHEIKKRGIAKSQILIIEALLRLRQAACHLALLEGPKRRDSKTKPRKSQQSAKTELLIEHLIELVAEGRKALVFSQFTSYLDIIRSRLLDEAIEFEYLDGSTIDRQERVDRFQSSPFSQVFLISLKAGGVGLNLTAADTVFLVDPWWNPAVESQAIDRAHRMGQKNKVTAYRLIARDTVEEKILLLQDRKRQLAALLTQGTSIETTSGVTSEDLELLLS
ncbi:MAG: hypothetical protein RJB38_850 [Pseudomonadota bacterium]|jgi:superfamily II DNA or RNA helicase